MAFRSQASDYLSSPPVSAIYVDLGKSFNFSEHQWRSSEDEEIKQYVEINKSEDATYYNVRYTAVFRGMLQH